MGHDKTVVTDHDRYIHGLGNPVSLDYGVDDFLVIPAVNLYPACIALRDGILLVIKDRPGCTHSPVDAAHHHREPRTCGPVKLLMHIEEPLGTGGGKDTGSHGGGR